MRPASPKMLRLAIAGLLMGSTWSGGCIFLHDNVSVNLIIPLGFGGSPGVFNPFGIVQALVNSLLGLSTSGGATGDDSAPSVAPPLDSGTIGVVVNRP